jgi:hypothetical protein
MTAQLYTVVPSKRGKVKTWTLLDATGHTRGESTDRNLLADLIETRELCSILAENCARVGILIQQQARYQCAEDEFNEFGN